MNIGADIAGMGAVGNLLFPAIDATFFSVFFTVLLLGLIIYLPYIKIASILKYLCIVLLVYLIVPFLFEQDWMLIIEHTFIPKIEFNKEFVGILVGILGTTIISDMQQDVDFGMTFSGLVMYFIILTTGTVLYKAGIHQIDTVEQAALALQPLAGNFAYLLFAVGVIGTGLLAIPVLSGSLSYIITETFGWEQGLDKKFHEAKGFYLVITISLVVGLLLNYIGISPIKALIYTAILYGVSAPILIAIILHICNNKKVMGEYTNSKTANILGFAALIIMSLAAIALFYLQFVE
jgi:Mn2+/Fe2+ NRAMP family transporter